MDWAELRKNAVGYLKKYSYVLLILGIGIVLMLLPESGGMEQSPLETVEAAPSQLSTQDALEEILSQIQGAGKVRLLLTVEAGEQTIYQTNESTGSDSVRIETVILTDSSRSQNGLVRQVNPPVYLGAVVVCQGADSAAVRLALTEAVADATGLTTDKITVLKMK